MDASTYDGLSEQNIVTLLLISQSLHFSEVFLITIHVIIVDLITDLQNILQVVGAPIQSIVMLYCHIGSFLHFTTMCKPCTFCQQHLVQFLDFF